MHRPFRTGEDIDTDATTYAMQSLIADADPNSETHRAAYWQLAELVAVSAVPAQVAFSTSYARTMQERADLEVSLRALLIDKAIQRSDAGKWYLSLDRIADGASFSSWMRSNAEIAVASERRNLQRRLREQHPTGEIRDGDLGAVDDSFGTDPDTVDQAVTLYRASIARSEIDTPHHAAAAALVAGLGISVPSRCVLGPESRTRLAALLEQNPKLADSTARHLLDGDVEHLDEDLVSLLDSVPENEVAEWLEHGPAVSHSIIMSVVLPTPPIKVSVLRALRKAILDEVDPRARNVVGSVVRDWAQWRTGMSGSKYTADKTITLKSDEQYDADQRALYEACANLRAHPYAPHLGATLQEITDWLEAAHSAVETAAANHLAPAVQLPEPAKRTRTAPPRLRAV